MITQGSPAAVDRARMSPAVVRSQAAFRFFRWSGGWRNSVYRQPVPRSRSRSCHLSGSTHTRIGELRVVRGENGGSAGGEVVPVQELVVVSYSLTGFLHRRSPP